MPDRSTRPPAPRAARAVRRRRALLLAVPALLAAPAACRTVGSAAAPATRDGGRDVAPALSAGAAADDGVAAGLRADVARLASPAFDGRRTGTAGADSAVRFLMARYAALGIPGAFTRACGATPCGAAYLQRFALADGRGHNVAARIAGRDSALRDTHVVIGAHLDHLGRSPVDALDADRGVVLRPGADDNASGTAAVLELARRLAARPPRRSVLLVHFDAEERGLIGSQVFVVEPPVPFASLAFMLNLDMVGRLRGAALQVDGSAATGAWTALADSAARTTGLGTRRARGIGGRSDHASFGDAGVPALALFTGFHDDYHRATDVAERVDVAGLRRVVDAAEAIVRAVADRDTLPAPRAPRRR